jgi:uncharacterized tellurite resistance protein B-like protein
MTIEQHKALAVFAFQMMVADHSVAPPEQVRVDWLEQELGVAGQIAAGDYFAEPSLTLFPDTASRLALMAELFVVALADGHRHPNENSLLKRLAGEFDFSWKVLADLLMWASTPAESRPPLDRAITSA